MVGGMWAMLSLGVVSGSLLFGTSVNMHHMRRSALGQRLCILISALVAISQV